MRTVLAALGVASLPGSAAAHSGHFSGESHGMIHFLTDPFHLAISAVAIGLYIVVRRVVARRRSRNPMDR